VRLFLTFGVGTLLEKRSFSPIVRIAPRSTTRSETMLQVNETVREYTDALVTNVWADGVNRTPCMAFTHNPAADRTCLDQANKSASKGRAARVATAKAQIKELDRLLKKYKINKERLVYMAPKKKGLQVLRRVARNLQGVYRPI
jgi:hypothetical protein